MENDIKRSAEARFDDLCERAQGGILALSCFLTPTEQEYIKLYARRSGRESDIFFFGGYPEAERRRLFILPDYLSDIDQDAREKIDIYFDGLSAYVKAMKIEGSGYRSLSHRDILGSVLSLGIERDAVGDIIMLGEHSALLFCTEKIYPYLEASLERVANDKVKLSSASLFELDIPEKRLVPINDTVASPRLDCIVSSLTDLSREKAQAIIKAGLCLVNYLPEERVDAYVEPPAVISVRGYGKFKVIAFGGETKKGRLRLCAGRFE